jgi:hypothetical protein
MKSFARPGELRGILNSIPRNSRVPAQKLVSFFAQSTFF